MLDPVHITTDVVAFKEEMYNFCLNYIKSDLELEGVLWNDDGAGHWEEILRNQLFANGNWALTEKGIKFSFEKYILGPGAAGQITIEAPYTF